MKKIIKKRKKWFVSKELIITLIVLTTIGLLTFWYLINSKKTYDLKNELEDLTMTIHSTYNRIKVNGDPDNYNLKKIFHKDKWIFNILKKKYERDLLEKRFSPKIEGIVFYNWTDILDLGSNSMESSNDSFSSTKINKELKDNEMGFLIGIEDNSILDCNWYWIDSNDKILTVYDTIQNSNGVNDPVLNICRGWIDGALTKYFILIFKNEKYLDLFNERYLENDWKKITITDWTNNLKGLALKLKEKSF